MLFLFARYKNQFWRIQPVFHYYNIGYYFCSPHIILEELPKTNKFCNFQNIETKMKLTANEMTQFTEFTQDYYLRNKTRPDN